MPAAAEAASAPPPLRSAGRDERPAQVGRGGDGAGQGVPPLRAHGGAPRPARIRAAGRPGLDPAPLGLTPENMAQVPAELLRIYVPGDTSVEALPHLQETYAGDRLRGRAHLLAHRARLAASRDRVRRAPWTDGGRRPHRPARAAGRRSRRSSASCTRPTWVRSGSASRGSTRWYRCSTSSSATPPTRAPAR